MPTKAATKTPITISILIATYGRPDCLIRCLTALSSQSLPPDEILIVVRDEDVGTHAALEGPEIPRLPIRIIPVRRPGTVHARNAALDVCRSDIVAIIDDDTAPYPDWLQRVMQAFQADPQLGGLGGRDRCFGNGIFDDRQKSCIGKITWYGKAFGNHHLGFGEIREVDVLKGANMSYRMEAVGSTRFDLRLRGTGAVASEDFCFSVTVKRSGWKLCYDPAAMVAHFAAERAEPRTYVGAQQIPNPQHYADFCYNQVVAIWGALSPTRRAVFFIWSTLIGTDVFPGLVQAVRFTPSLGRASWQRFYISQKTKCRAFWDITTNRVVN